jgi:hypothetical protein
MGLRDYLFGAHGDHGGIGYYSRNLKKFIYYHKVRMHDNDKIWKHKRRLMWSEKYKNSCLTTKRKFMYSLAYLYDHLDGNPKLERWMLKHSFLDINTGTKNEEEN